MLRRINMMLAIILFLTSTSLLAQQRITFAEGGRSASVSGSIKFNGTRKLFFELKSNYKVQVTVSSGTGKVSIARRSCGKKTYNFINQKPRNHIIALCNSGKTTNYTLNISTQENVQDPVQAVQPANGLYTIKGHAGSSRCLDHIISGRDIGKTQLWDCSSENNQKFQITAEADSSGYYSIKSAAWGEGDNCLHIPKYDKDLNTTPVQVGGCGNAGYNRWIIDKVEGQNNVYTIKVYGSTFRCLDVAGDSTGNGSRVNQFDCYNPPHRNQQWYLELTTRKEGGGGGGPPKPEPIKPETFIIDRTKCTPQPVFAYYNCRLMVENTSNRDIEVTLTWAGLYSQPRNKEFKNKTILAKQTLDLEYLAWNIGPILSGTQFFRTNARFK